MDSVAGCRGVYHALYWRGEIVTASWKEERALSKSLVSKYS